MNLHKRFSFIVNFLYFGIIVVLSYLLIKYALPLVMPFVLGFLIASLLRRPALFLSARLRLNCKAVSLLLVLLFYAVIGLAITLAGLKAFSLSRQLVLSIPGFYNHTILPGLQEIFSFLEERVAGLDPALVSVFNDMYSQLISTLGNLVSSLSVGTMGAVSSLASSLPSFFIKQLLLIISTFFIAADYQELTSFCMRQLSDRTKDLVIQIRRYVVGTLLVCIRSYGIIMFLTFVELSVGLTIIGVKYSVLIAFLIAIFDILPVLGTGGIMLPWTAITALRGNFSLALGLLIVYLAVTVIRNILEPRIVGSQIGLHPVVTLVSMFVGAQLFGVLGLFGFPIGLSLLRHLNETGVIRVFKLAQEDGEAAGDEGK